MSFYSKSLNLALRARQPHYSDSIFVVGDTYYAYEHSFSFFYGLLVPVQRLRMVPPPLLRLAEVVLDVLTSALCSLHGKQGNSFGFMRQKNIQLQPWIQLDSNGALVPDISFLSSRYDKSKYTRQL